MNKWIKCSDRLPDQYKNVLVTTDDKAIAILYLGGTCYGKNWWYSTDGEFDFAEEEVIAWQELPEPYEDEKEQQYKRMD